MILPANVLLAWFVCLHHYAPRERVAPGCPYSYVFTKPSWLVDLLKAIICHDHDSSSCPAEYKVAVERLARLGELELPLFAWLCRDVPHMTTNLALGSDFEPQRFSKKK